MAAAPLDGEPPISGDYLAVLADPESAPIGLTEQPRDASVEEGREAVFTVRAATSSPDARYQWLREGMAIDGAGYPSYTTPAASLADSGTRYRCVVSVPGVSVTSSEATLTVTNDLTPPSLVSAEGSLGLSSDHLDLLRADRPLRCHQPRPLRAEWRPVGHRGQTTS